MSERWQSNTVQNLWVPFHLTTSHAKSRIGSSQQGKRKFFPKVKSCHIDRSSCSKPSGSRVQHRMQQVGAAESIRPDDGNWLLIKTLKTIARQRSEVNRAILGRDEGHTGREVASASLPVILFLFFVWHGICGMQQSCHILYLCQDFFGQ